MHAKFIGTSHWYMNLQDDFSAKLPDIVFSNIFVKCNTVHTVSVYIGERNLIFSFSDASLLPFPIDEVRGEKNGKIDV